MWPHRNFDAVLAKPRDVLYTLFRPRRPCGRQAADWVKAGGHNVTWLCVKMAPVGSTGRKTTSEHQRRLRRRRIDFLVPVNVVSTGPAWSSPAPLKHLCTSAERKDVVRRSTAKGSSGRLSSTTNFFDELFFTAHAEDNPRRRPCCCCCILHASLVPVALCILLFMNFFAKVRWITQQPRYRLPTPGSRCVSYIYVTLVSGSVLTATTCRFTLCS